MLMAMMGVAMVREQVMGVVTNVDGGSCLDDPPPLSRLPSAGGVRWHCCALTLKPQRRRVVTFSSCSSVVADLECELASSRHRLLKLLPAETGLLRRQSLAPC